MGFHRYKIKMDRNGDKTTSVRFFGCLYFSFLVRIALREQEKLEQLKAIGVSYPAEIIRIVSRYAVRVGRSQSVYAECTYTNNEGKNCLVSSKSFMYKGGFMPMFPNPMMDMETPHNASYSAQVYVNPRDPRDYAVEILDSVAQPQADYDYREHGRVE